MNAERRKRIAEALVIIRTLHEEIEAIRDDEQEAYDAMPESFQNGERGEAMQNAIDTLDSAATSLDEASSTLEELE